MYPEVAPLEGILRMRTALESGQSSRISLKPTGFLRTSEFFCCEMALSFVRNT